MSSQSSRDDAERVLTRVVATSTRTFLQRVLDEVTAAIKAGRFDGAQPVLALGVMLGWWTDDVAEKVVTSIQTSWESAFSVTSTSGQKVQTARSDAMAFHITAVRDRLSRSALPEVPNAAFDQVRLSQSEAALGGWDTPTAARDIAERLSWEPDKAYWRDQKKYAEDQIDRLLDPLGRPGTPTRTHAHRHDPEVQFWQSVRADAVDKINEDRGDWERRATRIARTEATAAWNSGSLAALASEGRTHKAWLAHVDDRTRPSHATADGQTQPLSRPFHVGDALLMMPGDPSAPPWETVNCRCTVIGAVAPLDTDSLTAAATQHWRDQLRIPKGNGKESGRWTFTPWKHLDDLAGLFNGLGADQYPDTRAAVTSALDALKGFDANNYDVHDDAFITAAAQVADILKNAPDTGDPSLDHALSEARAGTEKFADTDWTLFNEATDIGAPPAMGRITNKSVWDGDLPGDAAVNPDLADKTSQWLKDELDRIKAHPVAPSPTARRKRAMYMQELNDRRDRDERHLVDPSDTDFTKPEPTDLTKPKPPAPDAPTTPSPNADKYTDVDRHLVKNDVDYRYLGLKTGDTAPSYQLGVRQREKWKALNNDQRTEANYLMRATDLRTDAALEQASRLGTAPDDGWTVYDQPIPAKGEPDLQVGDVVRRTPTGGDWYVTGVHPNDMPNAEPGSKRYTVALTPNGKSSGAGWGPESLWISKRQNVTPSPSVPDGPGYEVNTPEPHQTTITQIANGIYQAECSACGWKGFPGSSRNAVEREAHMHEAGANAARATAQDPALAKKRREQKARHDSILFHMRKIDPTGSDGPVAARKTALTMFSNLRNEIQDERDGGMLQPGDNLLGLGDRYLLDAWKALRDKNPDAYDKALKDFSALVDERAPDDPWRTTAATLKDLRPAWEPMFGEDPIDPRHAKYVEALGKATTPEEVSDVLKGMDDLVRSESAGPHPGLTPDGFVALMAARNAIIAKNPEGWLTNVQRLETQISHSDGEHWKAYQQPLADVKPKVYEALVAQTAMVHQDLAERYGTLPPEHTLPEAVIQTIGMFYSTRKVNNNCVLASNAYELRRRGIDAHPKQAKDGRSSMAAQMVWFGASWDDFKKVEGLKGRQAAMRYKITADAIKAAHPAGSRGTITAGWKNRSFGHIWNWEIDEKGVLSFHDAQTGQVITPQREDYWKEMDWRQVQFVRLDDKPLKPDIEVLVAPKEHSQEAQDLLHIGKTMTEMKATSSALLRKYNDMFNGRPSMFAPGYDEWNQRMIAARNEWQAASHALARYKESPDGQRLAKAGNAFPFLDPTKNRL